MPRQQDADTRYYLDLDLKSQKIVTWDFGQRHDLFREELDEPFHHRVYLTKGQYNKLVEKAREIGRGAPRR